MFEALWHSGDLAPKALHRLRDEACVAPPPIGGSLVEALDAIEVSPGEDNTKAPAWISDIAQHRDVFSDCVFTLHAGGEARAFKFLFALQQPVIVWVSPLVEADHVYDLTPSGPAFEPSPRSDYHVDSASSLNLMQVADVNPELMTVTPGFSDANGDCITSFADAWPLLSFMSLLPRFVPQAASSSSSKRKGDTAEVEPWAQKMLEKRARKSKSKALFSSQPEDATIDAGASDDEDTQVDPATMEELQKFREEWLAAEDCRYGDFQVSILGGYWTKLYKGVFADAFTGKARGDVAVAFCEARGMRKSARYEINAYGEEYAAIFARAWCSKMQFLFGECQKRGDNKHAFASDEQGRWVPPSDLARLETDLKGSERAMRRLADIRALG